MQRTRLVLAFATIYLVWGSTFLGIRLTVNTIPPLLAIGVRSLTAGLILFIPLRMLTQHKPTFDQWRSCAIVGMLKIVIAQGFLAYAEQYIPSSVAAILVATFPFWFALLSWIDNPSSPPNFVIISGIVIGFLGITILVNPFQSFESTIPLIPTLTVPFSALFWALGSMYSRKASLPTSHILSTSIQMMLGGIVLLLCSLLRGEISQFNFSEISTTSMIALGYLIGVGSLIAFPTYHWLIHNSSPVMLSTFAYVNPMIAMFLGCKIGEEIISPTILTGSVIILSGVTMIALGERIQLRRPAVLKG